jgi:predicted transcriptional regulator
VKKHPKKNGKPQVLTIHGKAEGMVQDAQSHQALIETIERLETLARLRRGLEEVEQGKTIPAQDVFTRMHTKHKIPKRA